MTISDATFKRAMLLIEKGAANADYFFEKLNSPEWIEPLLREGLFRKPFGAIKRGSAVSFPAWPAGAYLARMASKEEARRLVTQILLDLPSTDNPRVYEVVVDAAIALPAHQAVRLVPQVERGLALPYLLGLPEKVVALVAHLAEGRFPDHALLLVRSLFGIASFEGAGEADDALGHLRFSDPPTKIEKWEYGELLTKAVSRLVTRVPSETIATLAALLEENLAVDDRQGERQLADHSYIWRPLIEQGARHREGARDDLVTAVRDACVAHSRSSAIALHDTITLLLGRERKIFRRIALYVLLVTPFRNAVEVSRVLSTPTDWEDLDLHPEYELLLREAFGLLAPEVRRSFILWVRAGPDMERYAAFRLSMDHVAPSAEVLTHHKATWIRDRLAVLSEYLDESDSRLLHDLLQYGPPSPAGRALYTITTAWRGTSSPLGEAESLSLAWAEFADVLRTWQPSPTEGIEGPSAEGLAGSLRSRIAANPADAAENLHTLVDVEPFYQSAILEAIRSSLPSATFEWRRVLSYMEKVVSDAPRDTGTHSRWVRKCAASLISEALALTDRKLPFDLRTEVWALISLLAHDSDPSPEDEGRFGGNNMDPLTLSLNTVRGEAMHAAVRYGLWCNASMGSGSEDNGRFSLIPELRQLLDEKLDLQLEPSLAVRAVYGQWLPWLHFLDRQWTTQALPRILPSAAPHAPFRAAAWTAYLVYVQPFNSVLEILHSQYEIGIDRAPTEAALVGMKERPLHHLAEHLVIYYLRGKLSIDEGDLLARFFRTLDSTTRAHALEVAGRLSSPREGVELGAEDISRFTRLWEWRLEDQTVSGEELQAFGWWLGAAQLPREWLLRRGREILLRSVLPEPDHYAAEFAVTIAAERPAEAVEFLELMVAQAKEPWAVHSWRNSIHRVVKAALTSSDSAARAAGERLAHRLGSLGFRDFRELLRTTS